MTRYHISDIIDENTTLGHLQMAATKLLISLPQDLALRFRSAIPHKQRSKVIQSLIEAEVKRREDLLYQAALAVEKDEALHEEMQLWDATVGDGIHDSR